MAYILVAEDNPAIRAVVAEMLAAEGHTVQTAANGAETLQFLAACPPHGLVLDLMMPLVDGWGVLAATASDPRLREVPVLVLSAVADRVALPNDPRIRAALAKPFEVDELLDTVQRTFGPVGEPCGCTPETTPAVPLVDVAVPGISPAPACGGAA